MRKKVFLKGISLLMALTLLFETLAPTLSYALTSGPSQPEMSGFEPAGATDMVDVFSGDFKYNIPLLTVPGPNGGYPINIVYNGGVTMEEEASWVGLGWSLNLGAINRQMRGLPDDFNGTEEVVKTSSLRTNRTTGIRLGANAEIVGADFSIDESLSAGFTYSSYSGIGISFGAGANRVYDKSVEDKMLAQLDGINLGISSQDGIGLNASASLLSKKDKIERKYQAGFGFNSRQGVTQLQFTSQRTYNRKTSKSEAIRNQRGRTGVSFSMGSFTPRNSYEMNGFAINGSYKYGGSILGTFTSGNLGIKYMETHLQNDYDNGKKFKAYGYFNSHKRVTDGEKDALMDINREREFPVTRETPNLPLPIATADIYSISGQGTGGAFRAFRNDIGIYCDPTVNSNIYSGQLGIELAPATPDAHIGTTIGVSHTNSYSGPWRDKWDQIEDFQFQATSTDQLYQPYHFATMGEMVNSDSEKSRYQVNSPVALDIKNVFALDGVNFEPKVFNKLANTGTTALAYNTRNATEKRVQSIETFNRKEALDYFGSRYSFYSVENPTNPAQSFSYTSTAYEKLDHHTAAMIVRNPDGNSYVYGIPTYNLNSSDVIFSVPQPVSGTQSQLIDYTSTDASTSNANGNDHYFDKTDMPAYANSHLLTEVLSPDYVDLTNDGPTDDDFGFFVKFNYQKTDDNFKWRAPFSGANYNRGYHSNPFDDKASYMNGERESWYVHSVETKTHIAYFIIEARNDGYGSNGSEEVNPTGSVIDSDSKSYLLKEIKLYSKADNKLIKTVVFEYDYSLCQGVPNNDGGTPSSTSIIDNENLGGKLTLKKIYFTHLGNKKGSLSPYEFVYSSENPDYSLSQMDRWGYYKEDNNRRVTPVYYNNEFPYVDQEESMQSDVDQYMNAWSLVQVKLPSGGRINVEYESDDYAYVQDKQAMQMMKITGTGSSSENNNTTGVLKKTHSLINTRIFFELETPTDNANDLLSYIDGIDDEHPLYFKAYLDLKKEVGSDSRAYDYVDGYCLINRELTTPYGLDPSSDIGSGVCTRGYIEVKTATVNQRNGLQGHTHPFAKAAWEYMKLNRHDLLYPSHPYDNATGTTQLANAAISIFNDVANLIFGGYYNKCDALRYANHIYINNNYPSFIRLNSPDKIKRGGGQRVSKITMDDNWNEITGPSSSEDSFEYGVTYEYRMPDGTSSGVAEYEPMIGGDEIPHHLPTDRYLTDNRKFHFKQGELYQEEPFGESYFPAPSVGYRRVVIRSLKRTDLSEQEINKYSADGVTVQEFYTAKEFPVNVYKTPVEGKHYSPSLTIPFVGTLAADNHGYSQGYSIELNDMHGKQKAIYTYPHTADIDDPATMYTARQDFIYSTTAPFSNSNKNYLKNTVTVLKGDADTEQGILGEKVEFFIDMIQNSSFNSELLLQPNVDVATGFPLPSMWPTVDVSEAMYRSVVTNKVIYRNGILIESRSESEGSKAVARNLMFDAETGQALLVESINNFDKPVYSYTFPAHWYYEGMNGSYKNYGMTIDQGSSSSSISTGYIDFITEAEAKKLFYPGDEIILRRASASSYEKYWVSSIDALGKVYLIDMDGDPITSGSWSFIKVAKTARKNQQTISAGSIVSLTNPVTERIFPLFDALNLEIQNANLLPEPTLPTSFQFENCTEGNTVNVNMSFTSNTLHLSAMDGEEESCRFDILFPSEVTSDDILDFVFTKNGKYITATYNGSNGSINSQTTEINCAPCSCYKECLDGVLFANSSVFTDSWSFNYADVGNPEVLYSSSTTPITNAIAALNPWRFGTEGIWRNLSQYVYQVDRKQSALSGSPTNIGEDGTYENFVLFDWLDESSNDKWTKTNTVTRYSPYGYELENKNIIDIYSAALYGYSNSVVTAVASNASYLETAFDGFEDYGTSYDNPGHGHLDLNYDYTSSEPLISDNYAHTGINSLQLDEQKITTTTTVVGSVPVSSSPEQFFTPVYTASGDNRYIISAWFKTDEIPKIEVSGTDVTDVVQRTAKNKIEGWTRVETEFTITGSGNDVDIEFYSTTGSVLADGYVDDIRIQPFRSAMTSYVYDPNTLWLIAELDNRNYATFYNYDEEGTVVQVKKETERGVKTIQTTRQNIRQQ